MTGPDGNSLFCFLLKNLNVSRGGAEGNIEKFIKLPCNGSRQSTFTRGVGEHCVTAVLRCEVKDFAMLPTQRFWRETVSLLDVM